MNLDTLYIKRFQSVHCYADDLINLCFLEPATFMTKINLFITSGWLTNSENVDELKCRRKFGLAAEQIHSIYKINVRPHTYMTRIDLLITRECHILIELKSNSVCRETRGLSRYRFTLTFCVMTFTFTSICNVTVVSH